MTVFFSPISRVYYIIRLRVYTLEKHYRRTLQQMQCVTYLLITRQDKTNIFLVRERNYVSGRVQKPHIHSAILQTFPMIINSPGSTTSIN